MIRRLGSVQAGSSSVLYQGSAQAQALCLLDTATELLMVLRDFRAALETCERGLESVAGLPEQEDLCSFRYGEVKAALCIIGIQALAELNKWRVVLEWVLQYYGAPEKMSAKIMQMWFTEAESLAGNSAAFSEEQRHLALEIVECKREESRPKSPPESSQGEDSTNSTDPNPVTQRFQAMLNELVVGDTSGKLSVYKNDDSKPWLTRSCVGMVTCVGVGDICNKGKNFVVAVGAEGWFHLFDLSVSPAKSESTNYQEVLFGEDQKPSFTQHIPANTKVILISDIDGDGRSELVVGYTDRVVRAFRWEDSPDSSDIGSGQLVLLKKWLLEGQVDSLSVNPGPEGVPELMVSQPGCGYAILLCTWNRKVPTETGEGASETPISEGATRDVILHLTSGRIHNKNVSTHLIGSISRGPTDESSRCGFFALCTLDGTLKLMDSSDQLLWSVQVDHQLFALQKLDVTGDGREEVVACAWDGQTYIIDHNRTVVRFQFDENVNAFCAAQSFAPDVNLWKLWVVSHQGAVHAELLREHLAPSVPLGFQGATSADWQQDDVLSIAALEEVAEQELAFPSEDVQSDSTAPAVKLSLSAELMPLTKRVTAVLQVSWPTEGQYTCKDGRNSPCLVYVSFNHKIYVYWRVELERMESTNLLKVLEEKEEYRELLGKLHIDADDNTAVRDLIHNLLYGNKKNTIST
ncbi:UNVERIFIED_CONTAM: hypothetical protein FKN15_037933 [Acipenser sinensis]